LWLKGNGSVSPTVPRPADQTTALGSDASSGHRDEPMATDDDDARLCSTDDDGRAPPEALPSGSYDAPPLARNEGFLVDEEGFALGAVDGLGFEDGGGGDGLADGGEDDGDDEGGDGDGSSDLSQWLTDQQASLSAAAGGKQTTLSRGGRGGLRGGKRGFWRFSGAAPSSAALPRQGSEAAAAASKRAPVKKVKK